MPATDTTLTPPVKPHWRRNISLLLIGQALSLLGSTLVDFALIWWLTTATGSAVVLTGGAIAFLLPAALVAPFTGPLIDRFDRRWVIVFCDGIIMLGTLGLAFLFWFDLIRIWQLFILLGLASILGTAQWSAMQALTSTIVPEEHLQRIQGINSALRSAISIAGPPMGAFLMTVLPIGWVLSLDVITGLIALGMLWFIIVPAFESRSTAALSWRSVLAETREGLRFVRLWKGMLWLMIATMIVNFFHQPIYTLMPLLVTDYFGGEAMQFASTSTAWAVGTLAGGGLLTIWAGFKKKFHTILLGMVIQAAGVWMIALSPASTLWLVIAAMFTLGVSEVMLNSPIMAVMQSKVPEQWQGRIFTLVTAGSSLLSPLSLAIAGPLSEWLGVKTWYYVAGVGFVAAFFMVWRNRHLRGLEDSIAPEMGEPG